MCCLAKKPSANMSRASNYQMWPNGALELLSWLLGWHCAQPIWPYDIASADLLYAGLHSSAYADLIAFSVSSWLQHLSAVQSMLLEEDFAMAMKSSSQGGLLQGLMLWLPRSAEIFQDTVKGMLKRLDNHHRGVHPALCQKVYL